MTRPPRVMLVSPAPAQTFYSYGRVLRLMGRKAIHPPLGLLTLAALLPGEWPVRLVELADVPLEGIDWRECDIVMVTAIATHYSSAVAAIGEAARRGTTVVAGGPFFSLLPGTALEAGADIVVRGEAEPVMDRLLEAIARDEHGVVLDSPGFVDLERSPPPRFDLLDLGLYTDMAVQSSRGCPNRCEFCNIPLLAGREIRMKRPGQVLAELDELYRLGWRRSVFFVDDNFGGDPRRTRRLLGELGAWMRAHRHPFAFYTQASVDLAKNPELMGLMVEAGFQSVLLGIESTDQTALRRLDKARNLAVDLDQACAAITRAGLQIWASFIVGADGEEPDADLRVVDFAARNHIPEVILSALHAIPGTPLWRRLEAEGRKPIIELSDDLGNQTATNNFTGSRPREEVAHELIRFYERAYEPGAYLERIRGQLSRLPRRRIRRRFSLPWLGEVRAATVALIRHAFVYPSRRRFWGLMVTAALRFPWHVRHLMEYLVRAEHFIEFRGNVARRLGQKAEVGETG